MLYPVLLLDEGSPITETIKFVKFLLVVFLYALSFFFLFYNRRTSELKPIGVGLALLLAYVGFRSWPNTYSWEGHTAWDYLVVFFLCLPMMAAGLVYALTSKSPEE
jgi:hypothetical protein